jgi:hypothetical protein
VSRVLPAEQSNASQGKSHHSAPQMPKLVADVQKTDVSPVHQQQCSPCPFQLWGAISLLYHCFPSQHVAANEPYMGNIVGRSLLLLRRLQGRLRALQCGTCKDHPSSGNSICTPTHQKKVTHPFMVHLHMLLNSPSKDGPGITYILHTMSPHLKRKKLHHGTTKNTLAEAS